MTRHDRDPFGALARVDDQFDALVREEFGRESTPTPYGYVPAVEIRAEGDDILIAIELPGVDVDEDVDLEISRGRLAVTGRRRAPGEQGSDARLMLRELRYGAFRREFDLPTGITARDVEANYERGMLLMRLRGAAREHDTPEPAE